MSLTITEDGSVLHKNLIFQKNIQRSKENAATIPALGTTTIHINR
jgi:hypothetical protein